MPKNIDQLYNQVIFNVIRAYNHDLANSFTIVAGKLAILKKNISHDDTNKNKCIEYTNSIEDKINSLTPKLKSLRALMEFYLNSDNAPYSVITAWTLLEEFYAAHSKKFAYSKNWSNPSQQIDAIQRPRLLILVHLFTCVQALYQLLDPTKTEIKVETTRSTFRLFWSVPLNSESTAYQEMYTLFSKIRSHFDETGFDSQLNQDSLTIQL